LDALSVPPRALQVNANERSSRALKGATIALTMATHTVTADESTRGWILIKDGPTIVASIWSFDIMSVGVGPKDGKTQIAIRDATGLWHSTTARVSDVHRAVSAARVLYYATKSAPRARLQKRISA
jgi:hypothetical protein